MTRQIEKLVANLELSNQTLGSSSNRSRSIRRQLRALGHKGGLRSPSGTKSKSPAQA